MSAGMARIAEAGAPVRDEGRPASRGGPGLELAAYMLRDFRHLIG